MNRYDTFSRATTPPWPTWPKLKSFSDFNLRSFHCFVHDLVQPYLRPIMAVGWFACWSAALKWVFQIKPGWQAHVFNPWWRNAVSVSHIGGSPRDIFGGLWHSPAASQVGKPWGSLGIRLFFWSLNTTRIDFCSKGWYQYCFWTVWRS